MNLTQTITQYDTVRCRVSITLLGPPTEEDRNLLTTVADKLSSLCCTPGYYELELQDEKGHPVDYEIAVA